MADLVQQTNKKLRIKYKKNTYSIMCSFFVGGIKVIYVFNKNKIISYILASCFVLMLFAFHDNIIPSKDVELVKVSSNVEEDSNINELNNINNVVNNN